MITAAIRQEAWWLFFLIKKAASPEVFDIEEIYKTIKNINLISFNPSDTIILYDKRLSEKKEEKYEKTKEEMVPRGGAGNGHGASCDRLRRVGI